MAVTRALTLDDAPKLATLLSENRAFHAPWHPLRSDDYYTIAGQRQVIAKSLAQQAAELAVPLVIEEGAGRVVGTITLQSVIRGFFQSCSVGYWLAESAQGRGLATTALQEAVGLAFGKLRLHRVQAETGINNPRSQRVLERLGFVEYGRAESYIFIAGRWQHDVLYQLITPTPDQVVVP